MNPFNEDLKALAAIKLQQAELEAQEKVILKRIHPTVMHLTDTKPGVLPMEALGIVLKIKPKDSPSYDQPLIEAVLGKELFRDCLVFNNRKYDEVLLHNPKYADALAGAVTPPEISANKLKLEADILKAGGSTPKAPAAKASKLQLAVPFEEAA